MNAQNYTANYLLKARLKRNMSQRQFADFIGVSQNTVSSWERGKTVPKLGVAVFKLCKALKITPNQLFPNKERDSDQMSISETANTKPDANGLKDLRERAGLSQKQVSEKVGHAKSTIWEWESGTRNPPADAYRPLCEAYGVTLEELLDAAANKPVEKEPPKTPLKAARLRAFKFIEECAKVIGTDEATYRKLEDGTLTVPVASAIKLANFLGIDDFDEFKRCFTKEV